MLLRISKAIALYLQRGAIRFQEERKPIRTPGEPKLLHECYVGMLIDIALLLLAFLLSIPAITGYFAQCYGKSFWGWFAIGCFFPVIAQVALALLCHREAAKEQRRKSVFLSRYEDEQLHRQISEVLYQTSERKNLS